MKKIFISSVIALAFLTSCGEKAAKPTNDSASAPATTTTPATGTQVAAVKYQCPMKCEGEKTYDAAGACPMCKMEMKEIK